MRKKLALGGIFSLSLFVMIASIVRVVGTTSGSQNDDQTWMWAWAGIEMGVGALQGACQIPRKISLMPSSGDCSLLSLLPRSLHW